MPAKRDKTWVLTQGWHPSPTRITASKNPPSGIKPGFPRRTGTRRPRGLRQAKPAKRDKTWVLTQGWHPSPMRITTGKSPPSEIKPGFSHRADTCRPRRMRSCRMDKIGGFLSGLSFWRDPITPYFPNFTSSTQRLIKRLRKSLAPYLSKS